MSLILWMDVAGDKSVAVLFTTRLTVLAGADVTASKHRHVVAVKIGDRGGVFSGGVLARVNLISGWHITVNRE